jgi:apolipoprotein N-acyltransferase
LAGWAPVIGVYGVSWMLALVAASLAAWAVSRHKMLAAPLAAAILIGSGLGWVTWTQPLNREISVSLMQTNTEQSVKWRPDFLPRLLEDNHQLASISPARLMVMPETTLPVLIENLPPGYLERLARVARAHGGDLVFGVFERNAQGHIFNSARSLGMSPSQTYAKQHLVPFGEFSPPLFYWVYSLLTMPMSDQQRGAPDQPPLAVAGEQVAVNICYEDVFGEEIARRAPGATLMLNLSNLAWYGNSLAQPQHLQIARIRALESGRPMLRATNTGMTAVVEPDGQVRAALPAFTRGALQVLVRGTTGLTPYVRVGNAAVLLLCVLSLLLVLLPRRHQTTPAQ